MLAGETSRDITLSSEIITPAASSCACAARAKIPSSANASGSAVETPTATTLSNPSLTARSAASRHASLLAGSDTARAQRPASGARTLARAGARTSSCRTAMDPIGLDGDNKTGPRRLRSAAFVKRRLSRHAFTQCCHGSIRPTPAPGGIST
jgi:hypothetical protein